MLKMLRRTWKLSCFATVLTRAWLSCRSGEDLYYCLQDSANFGRGRNILAFLLARGNTLKITEQNMKTLNYLSIIWAFNAPFSSFVTQKFTRVSEGD